MAIGRWDPEGPPDEAYSRVTNPERFEPLHDIAEELLHRLELKFEVELTQRYGLDPELEESCKLARPSIMLLPMGVDTAPIVVTFSAFPGLHLRFGRWHTTAFPSCGCDACDETAESEAQRLTSLIEDTTAGRFREAIKIPVAGDAWKESEFWLSGVRSIRQSSRLDPDRARQLLAGDNSLVYEWKPWPLRHAPR